MTVTAVYTSPDGRTAKVTGATAEEVRQRIADLRKRVGDSRQVGVAATQLEDPTVRGMDEAYQRVAFPNYTENQTRATPQTMTEMGETGYGRNAAAGGVEGLPQMAGGIVDMIALGGKSLWPAPIDRGKPMFEQEYHPELGIELPASEEPVPIAPGGRGEKWGQRWLKGAGLEDVVPAGRGERWTRAGARGLVQSGPSMLFPALRAHSVGRTVLEGASGMAGEIAADETSRHTDNPWLIGAAGIGGGITPGVAAVPGGSAMRSAVTKMSPDSLAAAKVARLAQSAELLRMAGRGGSTTLDDFARRLEAPESSRLTVGQTAEWAPADRGGAMAGPMIAKEEFIAKQAPNLQSDIATQRAGHLAQTAGEVDELFSPDLLGRQGLADDVSRGTGDYTQTAARAYNEQLGLDVDAGFSASRAPDAAYDLPANPRKVLDTTLDGAEEMTSKGWKRWVNSDVVEEAERIHRRGSQATIGELENLRELANAGLARELAQPDGRGRAIAYLKQVVASVDETFQDVANRNAANSPKIARLRNAIGERAQQGQIFENTPMQTFLEAEDPMKGFRKIINSDKPVEHLRLLRAATRNDPVAWEGVQDLMARHVMSPELTRTTAEVADMSVGAAGGIWPTIKAVRKVSRQFDEVYGPGSAQRAEELLQQLQRQQSGRVGTRNFQRSVGSGSIDTKDAPGLMKWAFAGLGEVGREFLRLARVSPTDEAVIEAWVHFFSDKQTAAVILRGARTEELKRAALRWSRTLRAPSAVPVDQAPTTRTPIE